MPPYNVERLSPHAHEIRWEYTADDNVFWALLTSDRHWDNPHSDHDLQERHLKQAQEIGAPVLDHGDVFDAMQTTHDPRRDYDSLRGEHKGRDYLDRLVTTAMEFFEPYADQLVYFMLGNHEKAILDNNNTNLLQRLAARLSDRNDTPIDARPMEGWTRFRFEHEAGGKVRTAKMYSHHGWGGSARVTKGTIKSNRRAAMLADAHIVTTGHIHQSWELSIQQKYLAGNGEQKDRKQLHVQLPSYKKETENKSGYHVEKGREPRPVGARWLRFEVTRSGVHYTTLEAE
jgi:hypothetical protein